MSFRHSFDDLAHAPDTRLKKIIVDLFFVFGRIVNQFHKFRGSLSDDLVKESIVAMFDAIAKEACGVEELVVFLVIDIEKDHSILWKQLLTDVWTHDITLILQEETADFHNVMYALVNLL